MKWQSQEANPVPSTFPPKLPPSLGTLDFPLFLEIVGIFMFILLCTNHSLAWKPLSTSLLVQITSQSGKPPQAPLSQLPPCARSIDVGARSQVVKVYLCTGLWLPGPWAWPISSLLSQPHQWPSAVQWVSNKWANLRLILGCYKHAKRV